MQKEMVTRAQSNCIKPGIEVFAITFHILQAFIKASDPYLFHLLRTMLLVKLAYKFFIGDKVCIHEKRLLCWALDVFFKKLRSFFLRIRRESSLLAYLENAMIVLTFFSIVITSFR